MSLLRAKRRHEFGQKGRVEACDVVLTNAPGEPDRHPELLDDAHTTRAQGEVGVDARDLMGRERPLEVLRHDLDEHVARNADVLGDDHDANTLSK